MLAILYCETYSSPPCMQKPFQRHVLCIIYTGIKSNLANVERIKFNSNSVPDLYM